MSCKNGSTHFGCDCMIKRVSRYERALKDIRSHIESFDAHERCQFCLWVSNEALEKED